MIKVLVVDDQVLLRKTLLFMLSQDVEINALDGGGDGYEAIARCKSHMPDIVLMDLNMPKLGGLEAIKTIKELYPMIKVIVLTTFEDNQSIFEAFENGADGYVVKDIKPEELILAVKSAYNNLFIIHKNVIEVIKDEMSRMNVKHFENVKMSDDFDLTQMDIQIIKLIVDGKSNKEIANDLSFTEGTVKNKVSKLLSKLDLKDRTQVVVFAIKHNLY